MSTSIIILAAGKGTRMQSAKPKVLHTIANKSMLQHVVDTSQTLDVVKTHIIVGFGAEQVKQSLEIDNVSWVEQTEQLGTGHAVQQVLPFLEKTGKSIILYGDVPLISAQTLSLLEQQISENKCVLITQDVEKPTGLGRIVRDDNHKVLAIVEHKDANIEQLLINEINTGIMAVDNELLHAWLPKLQNSNAQNEYYLTDLIAMAVENNIEVQTIQAQHDYEVQGVNSKTQLSQLENIFQESQAIKFLDQGVHIVDQNRFDVRGNLQIGNDAYIDVNCIFEGENVIGDNVFIEPNCIIKNSKIGSHVRIKANSMIEDSIVEDHCEIGPFARLRPDTLLKQSAKIGNFVETKKSIIGEGSKVNHLSYIGDAEIGKQSNIGAGTITCNYDGVNKFKTKIGDEVRIGSNSSLVAPVEIKNKATTGAGTVVRKDVGENELAVSGGKQKNISGWQRPEK